MAVKITDRSTRATSGPPTGGIHAIECTRAGVTMATNETLAATAAALLAGILAAGGAAHLSVVTGSMTPFLQPGDRVVVRATSPERLRPGDILLVAAQPRPLLHRLLTIRREGSAAVLCTKGDAARRCDAALCAQQVLGRVVAIERSGRSLRCVGNYAQAPSSVNRLLALLSLWCASIQGLRPPWLRRLATSVLRRAIIWVSAGAWFRSQTLADARQPCEEQP